MTSRFIQQGNIVALGLVLLLVGCTPTVQTTEGIGATQEPSVLAGCERFQSSFAQELAADTRLAMAVDVPLLYSLAYQESGCQTADELRANIGHRAREDALTWQGGIMQVDGCWRWDYKYNCTSVSDQIRFGVAELGASYAIVEEHIAAERLTVTMDERRSFLLFGYNRGAYTAAEAIDIYSTIVDLGVQAVPVVNQVDNRTTVFVECLEQDACASDATWIDITKEFSEARSTLEQSLLIACKHRFGTMQTSQGDYCTGPGYGVDYPAAVLTIANAAR